MVSTTTIFISSALSVPTILVATAPLSQPQSVESGNPSNDLPMVWFSLGTTTVLAIGDAVATTSTSTGVYDTPIVSLPPSAQPTSTEGAALPAPSPVLQPVPPIIVLPSEILPTPTTVTASVVPTPTPSNVEENSSTFWASPSNFSDLDVFGVQNFASGKENLQFVVGIPSSASSLVSAPVSTSSSSSWGSTSSPIPNLLPSILLPPIIPDLLQPFHRPWTNSSTTFQLLYPSSSVNPGAKPVGGAEIYFTPPSLNETLSGARNVTFSYGVFFPTDFDWVLGGKLPGLFGGHETCSGGDDATRCFSTRMMWRPDGAGELYLYAPKDKQMSSLCNTPPLSVCDAEYGLSIGRGSFYFMRGGWTHISQTVSLNTPGVQDGTFTLDVNGERILDLNGVLYREDVGGGADAKTKKRWEGHRPVGFLALENWMRRMVKRRRRLLASMSTYPGRDITPNLAPEGIAKEGLLPPLLGPIESIIGISPTSTTDGSDYSTRSTGSSETSHAPKPTNTVAHTPSSSSASTPSPTPITFSGVFFSTFFGGHGSQYATPRDQYTWFRDFTVRINS